MSKSAGTWPARPGRGRGRQARLSKPADSTSNATNPRGSNGIRHETPGDAEAQHIQEIMSTLQAYDTHHSHGQARDSQRSGFGGREAPHDTDTN